MEKGKVMNIEVINEGTPYVFALEGSLDTDTDPELDEFASSLAEKGIEDIVVDMASCEYVTSAGLRVIMTMQKRASVSGSLVFRNVQSDVMDVFEMTGFDKILTIEEQQ